MSAKTEQVFELMKQLREKDEKIPQKFLAEIVTGSRDYRRLMSAAIGISANKL